MEKEFHYSEPGNTEINIYPNHASNFLSACEIHKALMLYSCIHVSAIVLSSSALSHSCCQEKINAKFSTIYGPFLGVSVFGLLCDTNLCPDGSE